VAESTMSSPPRIRWRPQESGGTPAGVTLGATALLVPPAALAFVRIARLEDSEPVILLETFTPVVLLPAYVVLAMAAATRRRRLALVSALLALCHLVWVAPELRPARPPSVDATAGPQLRLNDQNVLGSRNPTPARVGDAIRRARPDLVFLQEVTPGFLAKLRAGGALDPYPYSASPAGDTAIFSTRPLRDVQRVGTGVSGSSQATVDVGGRRLTLYTVHNPAPGYAPAEDWLRAFDELRRDLHAQDGPVVAAGDFNATWHHRPFRRLIAHGYREAHIDRGRGYARTWPVKGRLFGRVGGLIRIDHVLTRQVRAVRISEEDGNGSDHRALVADLVVTG
jgi:endonuclease/exonuclease/phosphatase (EEP) superfamily protein YafD